jgi:hypothetical protein
VKALILPIFLLFCTLTPGSSYSAELAEFKTDYCTFFPEGTMSKPRLWEDCCLQHDLVYWAGGTSEMQDLSDIELRKCVTKKSSRFYGNLMYRGVRLGHYSPIKSKTRWGHGWGDKRSFQKLTRYEKTIIRKMLKSLDITQAYKTNYLKLYINR